MTRFPTAVNLSPGGEVRSVARRAGVTTMTPQRDSVTSADRMSKLDTFVPLGVNPLFPALP